MSKRHQGSTRKTENVSRRAGCSRQLIIRLLILTRFLCSEKENTVFTDPKDRQVKYYYLNKKALTLSFESGQKEFLRVEKSALFLLSAWNLYLREIIFVTNVVVLTIETFLIERKARV